MLELHSDLNLETAECEGTNVLLNISLGQSMYAGKIHTWIQEQRNAKSVQWVNAQIFEITVNDWHIITWRTNCDIMLYFYFAEVSVQLSLWDKYVMCGLDITHPLFIHCFHRYLERLYFLLTIGFQLVHGHSSGTVLHTLFLPWCR